MTGKKTNQLGIRLTDALKDGLQREADKMDWSISKLCTKILEQYLDEVESGKRSTMDFIKPKT